MGYRQNNGEVVYLGDEKNKQEENGFVGEIILQKKERWMGRKTDKTNGKVGCKTSTLK